MAKLVTLVLQISIKLGRAVTLSAQFIHLFDLIDVEYACQTQRQYF